MDHRSLTHRTARAPSPAPIQLSSPRILHIHPRPTSTLTRLRQSLTINHRLLRPLGFLLLLFGLVVWFQWNDAPGSYLDEHAAGVGKWIPNMPEVIAHPHLPGMARRPEVSDISVPSEDDPSNPDEEVTPRANVQSDDRSEHEIEDDDEGEEEDPILADPLALLEADRQAAYDLYGPESVNEVLDELYNPPSPSSAPGSGSKLANLLGLRPSSVGQQRLEEHLYLQNGLLLVNPYGRHPIYDLVEKAESVWAAKVERQSKTLAQAVAEYRQRWGRYPPRGFDKWWAYVKKHDVQLPDEYDQILRDLSPFFAYSAKDLRVLQQEMKQKDNTYTVAARPGREGERGKLICTRKKVGEGGIGEKRMRLQLGLMRGYDESLLTSSSSSSNSSSSSLTEEEKRAQEELEAAIEEARKEVEEALVGAAGEGGWEATFNAHDGPVDNWDWDMGEKMREAVSAKKLLDLDTKGSTERIGWAGGCPTNTPLRTSPLKEPPPALPNLASQPKHFIHSHRSSMSPCLHPSHAHHIGLLSSHSNGKGPGPQEKRKLVFSLCKTELHGDIAIVPAERWEDVGDDPTPWEEKDGRLVWRGSTTGISNNPRLPWRTSQRIRLLSLLSNHSSTHPVLPPFGPQHPVGQPMQLPSSWLNTVLTDVSFVKGPIQCEAEVCEEMRGMFEWKSQMSGEEPLPPRSFAGS